MVCKLSLNANCKSSSTVYQVKCQGCTGKRRNSRIYVGEMARDVGERIGEDLQKYEA